MELLIAGAVVYVIIGVAWGVFVARLRDERPPRHWEDYMEIGCLVIMLTFVWPLLLPIALFGLLCVGVGKLVSRFF